MEALGKEAPQPGKAGVLATPTRDSSEQGWEMRKLQGGLDEKTGQSQASTDRQSNTRR